MLVSSGWALQSAGSGTRWTSCAEAVQVTHTFLRAMPGLLCPLQCLCGVQSALAVAVLWKSCQASWAHALCIAWLVVCFPSMIAKAAHPCWGSFGCWHVPCAFSHMLYAWSNYMQLPCLQFLGRALTLTSLAILEPELTAMAEREAQEMGDDLLNVSSSASAGSPTEIAVWTRNSTGSAAACITLHRAEQRTAVQGLGGISGALDAWCKLRY